MRNTNKGFFNTLAQSGTGEVSSSTSKPKLIAGGKGTDLTNSKALKGRAKRKLITQKMILPLVDIAKSEGRMELIKPYWNTYHCLGKVYTANGKLYGRYCKNRFCTVCCAIRKAEIVNKYLPIIKTWEEPYFVTLTIKAVPAHNLNRFIEKGIIRGFKIITSRYRKSYQRGKSIRLTGIKSLECNFNPQKKTYNPHLHLIVPNKETADILVNEWLRLWTPKFTSRKAQKAEPVWDTEKSLIEIVKCGSKIFTEPDVNEKTKEKNKSQIYATALYNIFNAMKGHRIFDRFGFDLPKDNNRNSGETFELDQYDEWVYDINKRDWINSDNDRTLTGYLPTLELIYLLESRIDKSLK